MNLIRHTIELLPGVEPNRFETWVTSVDYKTCPALPSVAEFTVCRLKDGRYVEYVVVDTYEAFEADMRTPEFTALEEGFSAMARVIDESVEDILWPAYRRNPTHAA